MCTVCRKRPSVARSLCRRCYSRARSDRPPLDGELERYGQADGHGQYGILDDDGEGVLCHECGRRYRSLGAHVLRAHGITAVQYRVAHGLARGRGLTTAALREVHSQSARDKIGTAGWRRFETARDPSAASAARTFPPAPAQARRAQARQAVANGRRARKVVVRTCPVCGAQWCPLPGGYARITCRAPECLRAYAARKARAHAEQQAASAPALSDAERDRLRALTGAELMDEVRRLLDIGASQAVLADAVGISQAGLSRYLNGQRVPSTDRPRPVPD